MKYDINIQQIIELHPAFETAYKSVMKDYGEDSIEDAIFLSIVMSEFSYCFVEQISHFDDKTIGRLFKILEDFITSSDERLQNAVATSFLENLQNHESNGNFNFLRIAEYLGTESHAYCKGWDQFTGVKSRGL